MCVPMFFIAVEIGGQLFVYGGTVIDYPLMGFGKDEILNTLTLAFASSSSVAAGDNEDTGFGYHQPTHYVRRLMTVLERGQIPLLELYGTLKENTILIDTGDISSLHFMLSKEDQQFLIESGRKAVREHFQFEEGLILKILRCDVIEILHTITLQKETRIQRSILHNFRY